MSNQERLKQIVSLVDERGFISVRKLSELCQVSEMTIRRDLAQLEKQKRLQRTFGGAAPLRSPALIDPVLVESYQEDRQPAPLLDRVDVLIATALNPKYDGMLVDSLSAKKSLPIIAESLTIQREVSVVAVDNYRAGIGLGQWAGQYARQNFKGQARLLDLTYYLVNTQARSHGFIDGLKSELPDAQVILSLDAQSRYDTAYQLTQDALAVHKDINLIFAINDITAWGAINACQDLGIDPQQILVLPFGLEGNTMRAALIAGAYCKAGLAMFPEIVGPVCIQAAIMAYNNQPLPRQLITPFMILTAESLPRVYQYTPDGWEIRWEVIENELSLPIEVDPRHPEKPANLPRGIGFIIPFSEHEWYQSLAKSMEAYASQLEIQFEIIDVHQSLKDEVDMRRREIARLAAQQVNPGEVILIDSGPIANFLAEAILSKKSITVITNAIPVFEILRKNPDLILILTGGAYRQSSGVLVGPTAEGALRELRADKLFLTAAGITLDFGLSHTNISEVTIKQAMLRSAREVILLADHTYFGQESIIQIAPPTAVDKLITDDALPASIRLELTKLGIEIILATV
jgi:DeoR/GlpR family transcriptional regulator of sugar metabolism